MPFSRDKKTYRFITLLVFILGLVLLLPSLTQAKDILKIAAVGDVMIGTWEPLTEEEGSRLFSACRGFLKTSDVAFFNYEGVLTSLETSERETLEGKKFVFKAPPRYGKFLSKAGFNMASIANNHINDFDLEGKEETMETFGKLGITFSGPPGILAHLDVRGLKVVMIAFAPYYHSHYLLDIKAARKLVSRLAGKNDIVIVSMHGGSEGEEAVRTPLEMEFYHEEERGELVKFARAMIDAGADLVLGHGPHVPRAMEVYKERLIAYSLGNFRTLEGFRISGRAGYAPLLLAELDRTGRLVGGRVISFIQTYWRPLRRDPRNRAARLIHELGALDFPDSNALDKKGMLTGY